MPSSGGFALVVALSLMAFILLLVLSISTLVTVESKSSSVTVARLQAEQAALLGLQVALGELQKAAGPDQRVTARADRLDAPDVNRKYYTGVWDSRDGTFIKWLSSAADASGIQDPDGLTEEADVNAASIAPERVVLHSASNSSSSAGVDVEADKVVINAFGSYAYWIEDEGVKAKVNTIADESYYEAVSDGDPRDPELLYPLGAAQNVASELISAEISAVTVGKHLNDESGAAIRAFLRKSELMDDFELQGVDPDALRDLRHDITHFSYGLLTNPVEGGLKEDLSLAFEHGNKDSDNVFVVEDYAHPTEGAIDVRGPTWSVFQDHYNLYKQMSFSSGIPEIETNDPQAHGALSNNNSKDFYKYRDSYNFYIPNLIRDPTVLDKTSGYEVPRPEFVQRQPVYLGSFVVISMHNAGGKLRTILNPVALLWNPYNVGLSLHEDALINISLAMGIEYYFNDPADPVPYKGRISTSAVLNKDFNAGIGNMGINLEVSSGESFEPGEIKLYSMDDPLQPSNLGSAASTPAVSDELDVITGKGFHLGSWLINLGGNRMNQINQGIHYDSNGLDMPVSAGASIQIAVTPMQTNLHSSYYAPTSTSPFSEQGPFYRLMRMNTAQMEEPFLGSTGSFSLGSGKTGRTFVSSAINAGQLVNPTPVGLFFFGVGASDNANNQLRTSTAVDLHLASNPRAFFSNSLSGSYLHLRNNPSAIYEGQDFVGASSLGSLFLNDRYAHFGLSYDNQADGQNRPVAWEFPVVPLTSIAQLQHVFFNTDSYEPSYAVGNSFASPYVRRAESVSTAGPVGLNFGSNLGVILYRNWTGSAIDFSYLLNEALWDEYFFSSLAPTYENGAETEDLDGAIDAFAGGTGGLKNARMQAYNRAGIDAKLLKDRAENPERSVAAHLLVEGAFNVNSTSIPAWRAFLGSAYSQPVVGMELEDGGGESLELEANDNVAAFSRFSRPTLDRSHPSGSGIQNNVGSGYRTLDATELNALATEIVTQVRAQGPFVSLADFINRELSDGDEGLMGPLQEAINDAGLNDGFALGDATDYGGTSASPGRSDVFLNPEAGTGNSYGAGPGYLLQGDLLNSLGPYLTVKSNTFTIRTYGEASNPVTGASAEVYLEATVQQVPEFVDPADAPETPVDAGAPDSLTSEANKNFGRQFKIVNIRYLDPSEV